jgi:hypothetical protein
MSRWPRRARVPWVSKLNTKARNDKLLRGRYSTPSTATAPPPECTTSDLPKR